VKNIDVARKCNNCIYNSYLSFKNFHLHLFVVEKVLEASDAGNKDHLLTLLVFTSKLMSNKRSL